MAPACAAGLRDEWSLLILVSEVPGSSSVIGVPRQDCDFFITYSGKDEHWATWIAATLEAAGYTTTIQKWDFRPGDNFIAAMDHALTTCSHTIGVLSPSYLASVFTRAEWTAAYQQAVAGKPRAYIPVRIANCELTPLLGTLAYVDLVDIGEPEARRRLLAGVAERVLRDPADSSYPGGASEGV
jgi:hypothetical protein